MSIPSFAALVVTARSLAGKTAAEFDYSLTQDDRGAFGPYGWLDLAAHELAGYDLEAGKALRAHYQDEIAAMVAAAKAKGYTGWSAASRGPIRYA